MYKAKAAADSDQTAWNNYLSKQGIEYHPLCWEWRAIISQSFGHQPYYLMALSQDNFGKGEVAGILPLFHVKSLLFGSALISVPYLNCGGIIADSKEAYFCLLEQAQILAQKLRVQYIELRHINPVPWQGTGLIQKSHKLLMELELKTNPEEMFSAMPPKLRSQIRRPSKQNIYCELSDREISDQKLINAFYSVFSENMRDLGTPVYPKRLFFLCKKYFGKRCRIITAWHEQHPVAAAIAIGCGQRIEVPWASSLRKFKTYSPNMLLYWEAIKDASLSGYNIFDFGRSSPNSGNYKFKEQWGALPRPINWYYSLLYGDIPDISPNNPNFRFLVSCWKHLPLQVTNLLGPWLTNSLP